MQRSPIITFRSLDHSDALEADIRKRIVKLETFYPSIMGCRVLVEPAQRHHEAGNRYHVRIDLTVPGAEIVVAHEPSLYATVQDEHQARMPRGRETHPERKHARVAVREAFDIARRRLQDYGRQQRGEIKIHAAPTRSRG